MPRLTKRTVDAVKPDNQKPVKLWDSEMKGFGVIVYPSGKRTYCVLYRNKERLKRMLKLGVHGKITTEEARDLAKKKFGDLAQGLDPAEEKKEASHPFTQLIEWYNERHLVRKSQKSQAEDRSMIQNTLLPTFKSKLVAHINFEDIQKLHLSLKAHPYKANRVLALLSKMFALAIAWGWRLDNPVIGVERYQEEKRDRWLNTEELERFWKVLDQKPNDPTACLFKFLLLTGARKGEALQAQWTHVDLQKGVWTKPSHLTKQKKMEHLPLSTQALSLLTHLKSLAPIDNPYVFPGKIPGKPLREVKTFWRTVIKRSGLEKLRIHDLRHTHASHLVSSGLSLSVVGKMLGHTQASTTQRYAHLADEPLREAANLFGSKVGHKKEEESQQE